MQKPIDDLIRRDVFATLRIVAECQAMCVTMLTCTRIGAQSLALHTAGAFLALCFWTIGTGSFWVEVYAFCWFLALLAQRARGLIDATRNRQVTLAESHPLTAYLCPDMRMAKLMEGAIVLAAGVLMVALSWSLGHLLMSSGAAILFLEGSHSAGRESDAAGSGNRGKGDESLR
jgi:hypothetical protein